MARLHEADFERRSRDGVARDWPVGYEALRSYYAEAEQTWQVGPADTAPQPTTWGRRGWDGPDRDRRRSPVSDSRPGQLLDRLEQFFVTAGAMNPTLTIAALALRVADHLDEGL